jgi:HAMP domain-containing protein
MLEAMRTRTGRGTWVRMTVQIVKLNAPERSVNDLAEDAIATALRAEREAGESIERTRVEAVHIAERARSSARSVVERTERALAQRLAEIDAEAALIAKPHELTADELSALDRAVRALAQELTGARS